MNDEAELRLHRAMNAPIAREEADCPVSTPQAFNLPTLAITFALCLALAAFVIGAISIIGPLFLAAVK